MEKQIEIVDRGRGMQLSTSRITVQDLVPHFIAGDSHEEILHRIPVLTVEEIEVVERYFQANKEALLEDDRRITERSAKAGNPPDMKPIIEESRRLFAERLRAYRALQREALVEGAAR